jgi:predicted nucleotidyltransferase component of viral defense system
MSSKAMSLKAKIKNYAKNNKIAAQVVLQNYMFEQFLARLSQSEYKNKFVIKGGMLIAAMVGLDTRATMDLDTTIRNMALREEKLRNAIESIGTIDLNDEMRFCLFSIEPIRKDDLYGGYRVRLNALYDSITTPLSIDVSTGDVITPGAITFEFSRMFDDGQTIELLAYNIETVLAEKVETILSRGVFNTRPRDFYDVYILVTTKRFSREIFIEALAATSEHRGSTEIISDKKSLLKRISDSSELQEMWIKYQKKFAYAQAIEYESIIVILGNLLGVVID